MRIDATERSLTVQRRRTIFYQYRADRAKRTLKGIDQQIAKAEKAVAGQAAVKRNRFVQLTGATKSINQTLEAKARALAGLKGYVTNLEAPTAEYVLGAYHQLWQIEKSFRMSKTDLRARPIYHHKRDSIEAHLTIVMAALAVSHWLERQTGWSIRKLVKTLRRYRSIAVQTGDHILLYSQTTAPRLVNIAADPKVAFNLHTDAGGGSVVSMEGTARIDPDGPLCNCGNRGCNH